MHRMWYLPPGPGLHPYVRFYAQREVSLPNNVVVMHPVPARAAPMLEFEFGDLPKIHWCDREHVTTALRSVVVGLQTYRRVRLEIGGAHESFSLVFQPSGLHRLFRVPMAELTNREFDSRAVLGASISELQQQLGDCRSFEARARVADRYLLRQISGVHVLDGVSAAANVTLLRAGQIPMAQLLHSTGLSARQFERRFIRQVGMRPKLYSRIARFEAALDNKLRSPGKSWLRIAHELGYHDQMHLIHDFHELSGEAPGGMQTHAETLLHGELEVVRQRSALDCSQSPARLLL
ncbi:MAG: helix-turn-helix domain-containing protein [Gammaproteobacteria bacterium]